MTYPTSWNRRDLINLAGAGAVASLAAAAKRPARATEPTGAATPRGNIKQSVCRWCYGEIPLAQLASEAKRIGYQSIELLTPDEFKEVAPLGLTCAMLSGACQIEDCYNRPENHDRLTQGVSELIEFAAAQGIPNVICFSGNRRGLDDQEGINHCVAGLKRVMGLAERKNVTVCMELLNSKVDHRDYMCDHTAWGVALAKQVGSPRFKLLYDIYHMQIMEGDVVRTIQENKEYIGHYHTGGNPGRHEIDETQELYYPAIVKAIVATGYEGFLGQEYIPSREPLASLEQGFRICDV